MLVYGSYIQVPNLGVTLFGGYCEAHLFSVPNDCLWYDTLWGPSQRVVTLFFVGLTYSFEEITFEISFFSYIALKYFALRLFLKKCLCKMTQRY